MTGRLHGAITSIATTAAVSVVILLIALWLPGVPPALDALVVAVALLIVGLQCASRLQGLQCLAEQDRSRLTKVGDDVTGAHRRLDDMFAALEQERANLGQVAGAVHQLRLDASVGEDHRNRLDGLNARLAEQSHNLGMVAGGLADVRFVVAGMDAIQNRYVALSDSVVDLAAYVDVLSRHRPPIGRAGGDTLTPAA